METAEQSVSDLSDRWLTLLKRRCEPCFYGGSVLKRCSQSRALVNGTFGIQLCGDISTANDMAVFALCDQCVCKAAFRGLTCTHDDCIDLDQCWVFTCLTKRHMQPIRIYTFVIDTTDEIHVFHLKCRTMDPACGFA